MKVLATTWAGAILAAAMCIAYNTSADVSALEGGRSHLTFRAVAVITGGGALTGLVVGVLLVAVAASSRAARDMSQS